MATEVFLPRFGQTMEEAKILQWLKKEGDPVQKDEPIAETKPWVKMLKSVLHSPITGTIETISTVTGQILLREPPKPIQVFAYVDGTVIEIMEKEGVVVETTATFIQGIFGVGGEAVGELIIAVNTPGDILTAERILPVYKDKIIVGGAFIQHDVIDKAKKVGVRGIIVGGFDDEDHYYAECLLPFLLLCWCWWWGIISRASFVT